jgi:hypothetical protein
MSSRPPACIDAASEQRFKTHPKAWVYFQAQAPSYQRAASWLPQFTKPVKKPG